MKNMLRIIELCCRGVSVMRNCSLIQELAWSKKSSLYFENNFAILLLCGISNTSIFKVRDVLHWVNFTSSNIFLSTYCWPGNIWIYFIPYLFSINVNRFVYIKSFFITITIKWCFCWYCWRLGFFSVASHSGYSLKDIL